MTHPVVRGDWRDHDWRVDPSQVIVMVGSASKIGVVCAACPAEGFVLSRPASAIRTDRPSTWRQYRYFAGDRFVAR